MNAPRIALAGAGDRRSGLAPGSRASTSTRRPGLRERARGRARTARRERRRSIHPLAPPRVVVVVVVALIAPPRARFSTTASVDDDDERDDIDVDVDVTALDDARRRSARHSVIVVIVGRVTTADVESEPHRNRIVFYPDGGVCGTDGDAATRLTPSFGGS